MSENNILITVVVIISVFISMTFHEAMHAYVSYWLGDDTAKYEGRLSLNPLRHIDPFLTVALPVFLALLGQPIFGAAKPVPFNPSRLRYDELGAALVGLAGPATNLVLAILGAIVVRVLAAHMTGLIVDSLGIFVVVNIGFFVFNMIPFPPLDGSRVLYAFAPEFLQNIMRQIESFRLAGVFIFLFLFFPVLQPILLRIDNSILTFLLGRSLI